MKAKLEFDLPEEIHDLKLAINACEMFSALHDVDNRCRSLLKSGSNGESAEDLARYVREQISDIIWFLGC